MKVYTYNNKVLTNSANGKWLKEKEPVLFVMNASNATYTFSGGIYRVAWQSPAYPDGYNGNGKQYILVNNNATAPNIVQLMYANGPTDAGPTAIDSTGMSTLGTSTGELQNNPAVSSFGSYLVWPGPVAGTLEEVQAYMANVSITIVDP